MGRRWYCWSLRYARLTEYCICFLERGRVSVVNNIWETPRLIVNSDYLKERLFGLSNPQGNHGESIKEAHFHVDNTPTVRIGILCALSSIADDVFSIRT